MRVGAVVQCIVAFPAIGVRACDVGIVIQDYKTGVMVIFQRGGYDGFSQVEIDKYLVIAGESELVYEFSNVIQLSRDFESGKFKSLFEQFRKQV